MSDTRARAERLISVIAATMIALACGTNYAYSCWAPQFATRMKLSSTESNLIGTFANLGMYAAGIPVGLFIDSRGPRPGVLFGALLMGIGYFALHRAYEAGAHSVHLSWLCLFATFTGIGGCASFAGAIKTSALNWPKHRGSATALPLGAFGLSAFFFATISSFAFEDETSHFLLLLAIGTFAMCFVGFFFLRVIPHSQPYHGLRESDRRHSQSTQLTHSISGDSKRNSIRFETEPGMQPITVVENICSHGGLARNSGSACEVIDVHERAADETSSLISDSSSVSTPGDVPPRNHENEAAANSSSHHLDIRGFAMVPRAEFWQLFLLMGLLAGVGLMTINNIGNDAKALWVHYDDSASPAFIEKQQLLNVSTLSIFSFCGRLLSGVGSDVIVKKLHMSRFWCLLASSVIDCIAQICGARVENPHMLIFVSALTGLGYGFLFGVYPSLVAQVFGINGLSTNWGFMTIAPVISGNIFNILYGKIFDSHSIILPDDTRQCIESIRCYSVAYWVTLGGSLLSVFLSLWSIRYDNATKAKAIKLEQGRGIGRHA